MGNIRSKTSTGEGSFMDLAQLAVFEVPAVDRNIELSDTNDNNVQNDGMASSIDSSTECSYTTGTSSGLSSQSGTSSSSFAGGSSGEDSEERSVSDSGSTTNLETVNSTPQSDFAEDMNQVQSINETRMFLLISQATLTIGFLFLLYQRLEEINRCSWLFILSPIMLCSLMRIGNKFLELNRLVYVVRRYRGLDTILQQRCLCSRIPVDAAKNGLSILIDFFDNLSELLTTAAIGLYLEGEVDFSLLIVLSPFWCEIMIGIFVRCLACQSDQPTYRSYLIGFAKALTYFSYKGLPAVLISLKVDGDIAIPWVLVFTPWWMMLSIIGLLSCCMCIFVRVLDPLQHEDLEAVERVMFKRKWTVMIVSMAFYLLTVALLAVWFLLHLSSVLDKAQDYSNITLLAPLFAICALTILVCPPLFVINSRIEEFRENIELHRHRAGSQSQPRKRSKKTVMKTASRSMLLLRQSSTVFRRAKEPTVEESFPSSILPSSSSSPVHTQNDDWAESEEESKPCYICMSSQSNGVLMECGHGGLCYACGLELARKGQTCPLCRAVIAEVIQIESTSLSFGVASSSNQVKVSKRGKRHSKTGNRAFGIAL